jgi:predicted DNA-binding WGR domain protein
MSAIPTPAEADKFLSLFFDLELANKTIAEQDIELGLMKETTRLQCIIPEKNVRKFYHITLYEYGYIAYYGRLDKNLECKYRTPFVQKFDNPSTAKTAYQEKIELKRFPPRGKDSYDFIGRDKH